MALLKAANSLFSKRVRVAPVSGPVKSAALPEDFNLLSSISLLLRFSIKRALPDA